VGCVGIAAEARQQPEPAPTPLVSSTQPRASHPATDGRHLPTSHARVRPPRRPSRQRVSSMLVRCSGVSGLTVWQRRREHSVRATSTTTIASHKHGFGESRSQGGSGGSTCPAEAGARWAVGPSHQIGGQQQMHDVTARQGRAQCDREEDRDAAEVAQLHAPAALLGRLRKDRGAAGAPHRRSGSAAWPPSKLRRGSRGQTSEASEAVLATQPGGTSLLYRPYRVPCTSTVYYSRTAVSTRCGMYSCMYLMFSLNVRIQL
jgi:hypothetical protein